MEKEPFGRWHILDFYQALPGVNRSSVRSALQAEVEAGVLLNPRPGTGLYLPAKRPPIWDPLNRFENLRYEAPIPEEGVRGSPRGPTSPQLRIVTLLATRFQTAIEEVWNEANFGYHFSASFDTPTAIRDVTISVYPTARKVIVMLGARGEPLRFWEMFGFQAFWLPGVTGIPIPAWRITSLEINREHFAPGVHVWAVTDPMPLGRAIRAMVKVYTLLEAVKVETRLTGDIATDVLLDDVRVQLDWAERWGR